MVKSEGNCQNIGDTIERNHQKYRDEAPDHEFLAFDMFLGIIRINDKLRDAPTEKNKSEEKEYWNDERKETGENRQYGCKTRQWNTAGATQAGSKRDHREQKKCSRKKVWKQL